MAKKLGKFLFCSALIGSAAAGGMALYKKFKASNDDFDDDDFLDFDDDFDDEEFDSFNDDFDDDEDDEDDGDDEDDEVSEDAKDDSAKSGDDSSEGAPSKESGSKSYVNIPSAEEFESLDKESDFTSGDIGF